MESYASCAQTSTCINGVKYVMGFMMRVKPERIRYSDSQKDYWVLNGTTDEMRPYRIMVKAHGVDEDYLTYITAVNRRHNIGEIFHYNIIGSELGKVLGIIFIQMIVILPRLLLLKDYAKQERKQKFQLKWLNHYLHIQAALKMGQAQALGDTGMEVMYLFNDFIQRKELLKLI